MCSIHSAGYWSLIALMAVGSLGGHRSTAQEVRASVLSSGPTSATDELAFMPDGKTLILGSRSGMLKLWDLGLGKERASFQLGKSGGALAVAPNGKTLAWSDGGTRINIWDPTTGKQLATLKGHMDRIRSIRFSGDGKLLASCANDFTVRLWDPMAEKEVRVLKHDSEVGAVVFLPDGQTLAAGDETNVRLWEVASGKLLRTIKVPARRLVVTGDGKTLATAHESDLSICDVETGKVHARMMHRGRTYTIAFSPDGKTLATGNWNTGVKLWDVPSGKERASLEHRLPVHALAFSPDGKRLATATRDRHAANPDEGEVKLWEVPPAGERPGED